MNVGTLVYCHGSDELSKVPSTAAAVSHTGVLLPDQKVPVQNRSLTPVPVEMVTRTPVICPMPTGTSADVPVIDGTLLAEAALGRVKVAVGAFPSTKKEAFRHGW